MTTPLFLKIVFAAMELTATCMVLRQPKREKLETAVIVLLCLGGIAVLYWAKHA